jgi:integrase/recombinase XerC
MAKFRKPFFRENRGLWYVWHNGKQINLGKDQAEAFRLWHGLTSQPTSPSSSKAESSVTDSVTVIEVLDYFLQWSQKNNAEKTFLSYQERLQSFVDYLKQESLLSLSAASLKPHHVISWTAQHENWSSGMKRGRIGAVQRAFNVAVEDGKLESSPIRKIRKPSAGRRENLISKEHYEIMLRSTAPDFQDLVTLAWETGARPQELFSITINDVDLPNRRWVFEVKGSKGKKRVRVIYLNDKAFEITKRRMDSHGTGHLLRNEDGRPWNKQSVGCVFYRLENKLGKRYALYDVRHTWATRALKSGVGVVAVANLMGHSNPRMVASVYQHMDLDQEHMQQVFEKIK